MESVITPVRNKTTAKRRNNLIAERTISLKTNKSL